MSLTPECAPTSGRAESILTDTPHLHFAIAELVPGEGWWQGTAIDPYDLFRR
jgi:peptidoglycan LD-endopeptidase LytH